MREWEKRKSRNKMVRLKLRIADFITAGSKIAPRGKSETKYEMRVNGYLGAYRVGIY